MEVTVVQRNLGRIGEVEERDEVLISTTLGWDTMTLHEYALRVSTIGLSVLIDLDRVVYQIVHDSELSHPERLRQVLWDLLCCECLKAQHLAIESSKRRHELTLGQTMEESDSAQNKARGHLGANLQPRTCCRELSRSENDWRVMLDCGREGEPPGSSLEGTSNSTGVPDR